MATGSRSVSVRGGASSLSHGGRRVGAPVESKVQKRDYTLVSPTSPESPVTLAGIFNMLKEQLDPLRADMDQVKESLDFTSEKLDVLSQFASKIDDLKKKNDDLSEKLKKSETRCQSLEEKVIALESASRRNNLKFLNVQKKISANTESLHEDCESTILEICAQYGINITSSDIERAHRVGYAGKAERPIIAKFLRYKVREEVFHAFKKLRGAGMNHHITVVEDFPIEVAERRRIFRPILNAAFESGGNHKAHLSVDKLVLDGQLYSTGDLDKLPAELRPENLCTITKGNMIGFFTKHSKLSNHYPSIFRQDGFEFTSVEQYLMFKKAKLFEDEVHAKSLGRKVENFNPKVWNSMSSSYMETALKAKFQQNVGLGTFLKSTGQKLLIEASPADLY